MVRRWEGGTGKVALKPRSVGGDRVNCVSAWGGRPQYGAGGAAVRCSPEVRGTLPPIMGAC